MFSDGLCNKGLILPESRLEVFAMASTQGRLKIETPPLECIKGRRGGKHVQAYWFLSNGKPSFSRLSTNFCATIRLNARMRPM